MKLSNTEKGGVCGIENFGKQIIKEENNETHTSWKWCSKKKEQFSARRKRGEKLQ